MAKKIELSYDDLVFSKEFDNRIYIIDTLKECNRMDNLVCNIYSNS